jgi:hypothetical protein
MYFLKRDPWHFKLLLKIDPLIRRVRSFPHFSFFAPTVPQTMLEAKLDQAALLKRLLDGQYLS